MNTTIDAQAREELQALRHSTIGRLFLRAHRDFSERSVAKLQERGHTGLTLVHTTLLMHLDVEGTRITTLAERAGVTKQAMGSMVADLEQHGYIARSSDHSDRRATLIAFTEAGWGFLRDAQQVKDEIEGEYRALLGDTAFEHLRALLEQLLKRDT